MKQLKSLIKSLKKGTHVTAMGSDTILKQELDSSVLLNADLIISDSLSQSHERGEIHHALNDGLPINRVVELGHIISGHVSGTVKISKIEKTTNNHILSFKTSNDLIKYIFPKGYVSLNGISLTIGEVNKIDNTFTVYLIPETLRITTMQDKKIGDMINLEIETQTKNMVDLITKMQVKK